MKAKAVIMLVSIVLFVVGILIIGNIMPQDARSLTSPYMKEVHVYVPSNVKVVKNFDRGKMSLATIDMIGYKQISSAKGTKNFISTSIFKS